MKNLFSISFLMLLSIGGITQTVSSFLWNSGSPLSATVGPNATSVSSSATISNGGNSSMGLNPGSPKMDINLVIPGSPTFDLDGIAMSIDFQREESEAYFVQRGNLFEIKMSGGNVSVKYSVENPLGGYTSISSGNIYAVPNDDIFRTYTFTYVPLTGIATFSVNDDIKWTKNGTNGLNLYWNSSDDVVIGKLADGSGTNKAIFDNFIVAALSGSALPITLNYFSAERHSQGVKIDWETACEINNDYFTVEKSNDATHWTTIRTIAGQGNSSKTKAYSAFDYDFWANKTAYYRLKQTDFNGDFSYSEIQVIEPSKMVQTISVFPNPAGEFLTISNLNAVSEIVLIDLSGKHKLSIQNYVAGNAINVSQLPRGHYLLMIRSKADSSTQKIILY